MRSPPPLSHQRQQHRHSKMKPCPAKTSACSRLPVHSQPGPGPRTLLLSLPASPHTTSPLPSRFLSSQTTASPLPPGWEVKAKAEPSPSSSHSGLPRQRRWQQAGPQPQCSPLPRACPRYPGTAACHRHPGNDLGQKRLLLLGSSDKFLKSHAGCCMLLP